MGKRLKKFFRFLERENVIKLFGVILIIILISGFLISILEPELSIDSGIWWSIVTLTTVGYGDISPSTPGGRLLAVLIMFFGIGLLGMLSASLATMLISKKIKENRGMCASTVGGHIIICEWNHRARSILKELRAALQTRDLPIVLVADIDVKPVDDDNLIFIRGVVSEETLEKANLREAKTVIVLGDDRLEATARDAKVVLTTLTIESMNPEVYSVVELVDKVNEQHCLRANADEIIIGSELSSHLIATAATEHGISGIVSELLSNRYGNEICSLPVPAELVGQKFLDAFVSLKKERNITVFGMRKGRDGEFLSNPDGDSPIGEDDLLLVISHDREEG